MKQEKKIQPNKVSTAVTILWITIALGLLQSIVGFSDSLKAANTVGFGAGFVIFVAFFSFAVVAFFIYKIGKGQNWARITFLILFIIGIPFSLFSLTESFTVNPISGILELGQTILMIIALVFLFQKQSSEYFRSKRTD